MNRKGLGFFGYAGIIFFLVISGVLMSVGIEIGDSSDDCSDGDMIIINGTEWGCFSSLNLCIQSGNCTIDQLTVSKLINKTVIDINVTGGIDAQDNITSDENICDKNGCLKDKVNLTGENQMTGTFNGSYDIQTIGTVTVESVDILASASQTTALLVDAETTDYTGTSASYNIYSDRKLATPSSSTALPLSYGIYNQIDQGHILSGTPGFVQQITMGLFNNLNTNSGHSSTGSPFVIEENTAMYNLVGRTGTITGDGFYFISNFGEDISVQDTTVISNAGGNLVQDNKGVNVAMAVGNIVVAGTATSTNKAFSATVTDSAGAGVSVASHGYYCGGISGDSAYCYFNSGSADNKMGNDNIKTCSGSTSDACWYYDNQDMILEPNAIGSGQVVIEDNNNFDSGLGIGFDRTSTRFNIEGEGSEDTSTGTAQNLWLDYWIEPSGTITGSKWGIGNIVRWNGVYNVQGTDIRSINNVANINTAATSGIIDKWTMMVNRLNQDGTAFTGQITDLFMYAILINGANKITIDNYHGYYHPPVNFTGDSNIALEIKDITGADENYAIKTEKGNIQFGESGDYINLSINGNVTMTNLTVRDKIIMPLSHMHGLATAIHTVPVIDTWYNVTFNASLGDIEHLIFEDNNTVVINHTGHYAIHFGCGIKDASPLPNADVGLRIAYTNGTELSGSYVEDDTTKQNADIWLEHTTHTLLNTGNRINMQYIASDTDVTIEKSDTYATQPFNCYGYIQEVI